MNEDWENIMLKQQYNELANKLSQIRREMETVGDVGEDLEFIATDTIRINKEVVEEDTFDKLRDDINQVKFKLDSTIAACERM